MTEAVRSHAHAFPMKRFVIIFFLPCSTAAYAWNGTGHKAIALIAYEHLTPTVKQDVDQILAKHPDYPKWVADVPATDPRRVSGRRRLAGCDPERSAFS